MGVISAMNNKYIKYFQIGISVFFLFHALLALIISPYLPGGIRIFTTVTDSMAPTIRSSDLYVTVRQEMNSYQQGDIISFYVYKSNPVEIRTHRIYRLGGNVYVTKGDANEAIDADYVRPRLVIGKVVTVIPFLGLYGRFIKSDIGTIGAILIPALIIISYQLYLIARK